MVDPYCKVQVLSDDNYPLPDYFEVHMYTFPALQDSARSFWDIKATVLAQSPTALHFEIIDENPVRKDQVSMTFTATDLTPQVLDSIQGPGEWTEFALKQNDDDEDDDGHLELVVAINISDDWVVPAQDIAALTESNDDTVYQEFVIEAEEVPDNALLQSCKCEADSKAVLWILGRNDVFMHPHVKERLFPDYFVYVLNYSMNGACRSKGWVQDAH